MTPAPPGYEHLNPYSRIIVDEARRRGIAVEVLDASTGELALSLGPRRVTTVESLSELTSAVAFRRCDHKAHTRRVLARAGLRIPAGRMATHDGADLSFVERHGDVVVKPARGEGGAGVTVGVADASGLAAAIEAARAVCSEVLLEQRCHGQDLRVVVIAGQVVAASVRRPPAITGTGARTVAELISDLSAARAEATGGASQVPLDDTTRDVVRSRGYDFDTILPAHVALPVRNTANLHTGGTIHDVTADLHPHLEAVAVRAAEAIEIPVVGLDFIVAGPDGPDYVIIEANEQPGLANHEPQPTAQRFVDLLFPESSRNGDWTRGG